MLVAPAFAVLWSTSVILVGMPPGCRHHQRVVRADGVAGVAPVHDARRPHWARVGCLLPGRDVGRRAAGDRDALHAAVGAVGEVEDAFADGEGPCSRSRRCGSLRRASQALGPSLRSSRRSRRKRWRHQPWHQNRQLPYRWRRPETRRRCHCRPTCRYKRSSNRARKRPQGTSLDGIMPRSVFASTANPCVRSSTTDAVDLFYERGFATGPRCRIPANARFCTCFLEIP